MKFYQFFLASFACYRITVLICRDKITLPLRTAIPKLTSFLTCTWCVSVWVATGIEAAFYFSSVTDIPIVTICIVFALSAVTIILDRTFSWDS